MDLSKYSIPLSELPEQTKKTLDKEIKISDFKGYESSNEIITSGMQDGIHISEDFSYLIKCTTQMRNVNSTMIDWWFTWHLPETQRYKLWHPEDHISAEIKQVLDKSKPYKKRYVGIDSYVEEYIGNKYSKLCISFKSPDRFGLTDLDLDVTTAICAEVKDLETNMTIAQLLHYVSDNANGCSMQSYFWLGNKISHENRILNLCANFFFNFSIVKRYFINDTLAKSLLRHCCEEMNHLSIFLPELYKDISRSSNSS